MKIDMLDLRKSDDRKIFNKLQPIINENLVSNGGTLRQAKLLEEPYEWTHLFLFKDGEKIVGFAILRYSSYDQRLTGYGEYYYISNIVFLKKYQGKGYGTELLKTILETIEDLPVVASVLENNERSLRLFIKEMEVYNKHGKYYRFMDEKSYKLRDETISGGYRV